MAGSCSIIARNRRSAARPSRSATSRSMAAPSAPAAARSASVSTADHSRPAWQSSKPRKPHHSRPTKTGTMQCVTTLSDSSISRSMSGESATAPTMTAPLPRISIHRAKVGAYGNRWFSASSNRVGASGAHHSNRRSIVSRPASSRTFWNRYARSASAARPEAFEDLVDPVGPQVVAQEAFGGEGDGAQHGLTGLPRAYQASSAEAPCV